MTGKNVGKTCRTHYRGTFNDGTQFDSSYDRGQPLEFICGAGQMIKGFDAAVAEMEVGQVKDIHLMRRYYVGITRAKNRLFIHTNGDCFNHLSVNQYLIDQRQYDMPEEIILQLSHKDVNLRFFKERKQEVLALRGGDSLIYSDFFLYSSSTDKPIAKLSSRMQGTLSE